MPGWSQPALIGVLLAGLVACGRPSTNKRDAGPNCVPVLQAVPGETATTLISFAEGPIPYVGYEATLGLTVDSRNVYATVWSRGYFPDIVRVPINGGVVATLFHGDNTQYTLSMSGPVSDFANVYWYATTGVWQAPIPGGAAQKLSHAANAGGVAVSATDVYWTNYVDINLPSTTSGVIVRTPIGGGAPTTLFAGPARPQQIAVDDRNVYWTAYDYFNPGTKTGAILQLPLGGGTPATLAQSLNTPTNIALDDRAIYWSDWRGKEIMKVPIGGGDVVTLVTTEEEVGGFAARSGQLYWTTSECGNGIVARMPTNGGDITVLATGMGGPLALDDTSVYLGAGPDGLTKLTPR